jgi:hypothetical protein
VSPDHPSISPELSNAKYQLELFISGGDFNLLEDDRLLGSVSGIHALAEISFGKLILSCWTEEWSKSWRVFRATLTQGALLLDCTKHMGRTASVLLLTRALAPAELSRSRSEFSRRISALITAELSGLKVERADVGRLDQRNLRGIHTRLVIRDGRATVAGIAIGQAETQHGVDSALAAGIVWLDDLRRKKKSITRLFIFIPSGRAATIATRLCAVEPPADTRVSLFEVNESQHTIEPAAGFDQGDLTDRLRRVAHRSSSRAEWPRERRIKPEAQSLINRITLLAPGEIETHKRGSQVLMSIRGLEFARVATGRRLVEFGGGGRLTRLSESNWHELTELADQILCRRQSGSPDPGDLLFRAQSERWLESIILRDVAAIDSTLDSRFAYSQVPAYRGEQRSFIDLLTVTRSGRLVVIELKVSEDPDFPFQGLDYWLRVEWHRRRGDFQKRGYFKGLKLLDEAPLLYLVAPLFRFHETTELVSSWISESVPIYRIGINEDWRNGVRVLLTERLGVSG